MKSVVVKSSELGINCWSPLRFVKQCFKCYKYDRCKHPEKVVDETYDRMQARVDGARAEVKEMLLAMKVYEGG